MKKDTKIKQIKVLNLFEILELLKQVNVTSFDGEQISANKSGSFGYYDPNNRTIYYDSSRSSRSKIRTIIHELTHAYNDIFSLRDSERNAKEVERNTWRDYKSGR